MPRSSHSRLESSSCAREARLVRLHEAPATGVSGVLPGVPGTCDTSRPNRKGYPSELVNNWGPIGTGEQQQRGIPDSEAARTDLKNAQCDMGRPYGTFAGMG